ncbi:MAG TPA: glutamate mutase L [Candidatus Sulfomarinibacteraceae bacterium]|nr:glutamate mutase L [Candidatus Sulfomarinibacteraceae bacterium]
MIVNDSYFPSFLLADCGSTATTVALFDITETGYRLVAQAVAPTTAAAPWADVSVGVQVAIGQLSKITGRPLLTDDGDLIIPRQENGAGVDRFGVTVSAAPPLRLVTAGLLEDVSLASARRAVRTIYAQEVDSFSLNDTRDEQEQIEAMITLEPDLILLTGGTDGGDTAQLRELLQKVELSANLFNGAAKPQVLYAGNSRLRESVTASLSSLTNVHVAGNVRPTLQSEQLADAMQVLGKLYEELKVGSLPGIQEIRGWSQFPVETTARAFGRMIEYFAALYESRIMGLDLGSNSVVLATARAQEGQIFIDSNAGMGRSLVNLLDNVPLPTLLAHIPYSMTEQALRDFIQEKALYPQTVPMTEEELYLEQALARQVIRYTFASAAEQWGWSGGAGAQPPPFSLLVLRGQTLARAPRPGQAMLMALDALQPSGIFSVAVDRYGVLPLLGLLATQEPSAVVQILEGGVLVEHGWVIAPSGPAQPGKKVLRIMVDSADKGEYRIDAEFGELINVPLDPGIPAQLTLEPERRIDVGFGPGRSKKITVHGGAAGLVVDCRGRPLQLPDEGAERQSILRQWQWDMGG